MKIDTASYPYQNLWITYYLEDEKGNKLDSQRVNYDLFDKKTGKPQTSGIFSKHQLLLNPPPKHQKATAGFHFPKPGIYRLRVEQFMRKEGVPGVVSTKFSLIQHSSR